MAEVKSRLRAMLMTRQERLHFNHEKDHRRRRFLSLLQDLPLEVWLYEASATTHGDSPKRAACLTALAGDLQATGCDVRLFIETEDSIVNADRALLYRLGRKWPLHQAFAYAHVRAGDEPALWVSDATAWSWRRGGNWRRSVEPIVTRHLIV